MHIGLAVLIVFLLWLFWPYEELAPLPENQRGTPPPAPPTSAQRRIALQLGLDPDRPESWPHETIDDLVRIKRRDGNFGLVQAMRKLTTK
jgi:hypothetical protein